MGSWRRLDSPKLQVPLEMREVTGPGAEPRIWEVQELRAGAMFKVVLALEALKNAAKAAYRPRREPTEAEIERAVCLGVENALLSPPDKEPGMTYDVAVTSDELHEASAAYS
jgi:hypothetical protein